MLERTHHVEDIFQGNEEEKKIYLPWIETLKQIYVKAWGGSCHAFLSRKLLILV